MDSNQPIKGVYAEDTARVQQVKPGCGTFPKKQGPTHLQGARMLREQKKICLRKKGGVPAVAESVKNPTALAWVTAGERVRSLAWHRGFKDAAAAAVVR